MKTYTIHQSYINTNGALVPSGEYEENTFDLAEARAKSIVTLYIGSVEKKEIEKPDTISLQKFNTDSDFKVTRIESTSTIKQIQYIRINSVEFEAINAIKYVSKKDAEKVITLRKEKRFQDYEDLNKRVPLAMGRKWEDLTALDFEYVVPSINKPIITST